MKKLMCTMAAVFISAFTMNAQQDADAAAVQNATKTESAAPATKTDDAKPAVRAVQVRDSDVVNMKSTSTSPNKVTTKPVSRATIIENEKAEKAAKATKAVKKDN
jgi:hypothetical protein